MAGRQSTLGTAGAEFELQIFKSHQSFSAIFDDAERLYCVTYCSSPDDTTEVVCRLLDLADYDDVDGARDALVDY